MKKIITLGKESIEYNVTISDRAKVMRLSIYHTGEISVILPRGGNENLLERFLIEKSSWILNKLNYFKNNPKIFLGGNRRTDFLKYKEETRKLVYKRLTHFNQYYHLSWKRIAIKNTKSRWGSCSAKKNLNFSYKLALLPQELTDYVIVHELCHLEELNHGEKFWGLVSKTIPNYKLLRKELKMRQ